MSLPAPLPLSDLQRDFLYHLELLLEETARALFARSPELRMLDAR